MPNFGQTSTDFSYCSRVESVYDLGKSLEVSL